MKNLNGFIFFLLFALSFEASAGTIRHDVPDEKYVGYGKKHECVLKIGGIVEEEGKEISYHGSCVALSRRWVITAAHVVKGAKRNFLILEKKEMPIQKIVVHKDYNESFGSIDLALCKLEEDLELDFYPQLYDKEDEVGKICGIAGYGKTGTGLTGANRMEEGKRGGSNKIEAISDRALFCVMNKAQPTELEFLISHGDSGGGLFIDGKLAGINSSVLSKDGKTDSNYGDESCHIRVSKQKEWIVLTIEKD